MRSPILLSVIPAVLLACVDPGQREQGPSDDADAPRWTTLDQGWTEQDAWTYWYTAQGSYVVPYEWFLALETRQGGTFTSQLSGFGFLPGPRHAEYNPDGLPIGVTSEAPMNPAFRPETSGRWLGVTCAACHVGAIEHQGRQMLIDGAPALVDFEAFSLGLEDALTFAQEDFDAFRGRVGDLGADVTRAQLEAVTEALRARNRRSFFPQTGEDTRLDPGPGRVDAFGVILNEVVAHDLGIAGNASTPDAPVSYPPLWDRPAWEWVQYGGTSHISFTRNVGEVLGVFGRAVIDPRDPDFLQTTIQYDNLIVLEDVLRVLQPPAWPSELGPVDTPVAAMGAEVYRQQCESCHETNPATVRTQFGGAFIPVQFTPPQQVGTDARYMSNIFVARAAAETGPLEGTSVLGAALPQLAALKFVGDSVDAAGQLIPGPLRQAVMAEVAGAASFGPTESAVKMLGQFTLALALKYYADNGIAVGSPEYIHLTGGADFRRPPAVGSFRAAPLRGIWASAPYLHNGSVRTLRELLTRPEQRETTFRLGTREFDTEGVGFRSAGDHVFDATRPGNSNAGHPYGTQLEPDQKRALIEYLKTL